MIQILTKSTNKAINKVVTEKLFLQYMDLIQAGLSLDHAAKLVVVELETEHDNAITPNLNMVVGSVVDPLLK